MGIRVIANGSWGFAAGNEVTKDAVAKIAERAVAVAKANSKILKETRFNLRLKKGYGEVSWKRAPIEKNAFEVPIKEKIELLMAANGAALAGGANFVNSSIFSINEQKYFASTDGSYITTRIYTAFTLTSR